MANPSRNDKSKVMAHFNAFMGNDLVATPAVALSLTWSWAVGNFATAAVVGFAGLLTVLTHSIGFVTVDLANAALAAVGDVA